LRDYPNYGEGKENNPSEKILVVILSASKSFWRWH